MLNSKLLQLIDNFSPKEYPSFARFIRSPYYNKRHELIKLYDIIYDVHRKGKSREKNLKREEVYKNIFPPEPFNSEKFEKLKNELANLILKYWTVEELKINDRVDNFLLLDAIGKRNLNKFHFNQITKLKQKTEEKGIKKTDDYLDLFFIHQELHTNPLTSKFDRNQDNIEIADDNLNSFFALSKLQLACELLNRQIALEQIRNIPLLIEVETYINDYIKKETPLFQIYLQLLSLLRNGYCNIKYSTLEDFYFSNINYLTLKEQFEIFLFLSNLNIRHLNAGNNYIQKKQFQLYKKAIENNIMFYNSTISKESFTNIVGLAAHEKQVPWARDFIKKNSKYLSKEIVDITTYYCSGYLAFCEGDYDASIQIFSRYKFDKSIYDTKSRFILIKALFELIEDDITAYERLKLKIDAFMKYLDGRPFGKNRIQGYKNFASYVKKIALRKSRNESLDSIRNKYRENIEEEPFLKGRSWLLNKI